VTEAPRGLALGRAAHADGSTRIVPVDEYVRHLLATRAASALRRRYFEGSAAQPRKKPAMT